MRLPVSKRIYRLAENHIAAERVGKSPFVLFSDEVLRHFYINRSQGTFVVAGEPFRIVQPSVLTEPHIASICSLAMKESVFAQLLRVWYVNILPRINRNLGKYETRFLRWLGYKNGDLLPLWSVRRWLNWTLIRE